MTRSGVVVTVAVKECRKVRSPRSEAPICFLRLEHGAEVMGESGRVTCEGREGVMEGGKAEGVLQCDPSQRESVDKLIQNPIIITLLEVLPKDKKSKEEKTAELGHLTFDLLPLVCGERCVHQSASLVGGEGGEGGEKAEVDIEVKTSQDVLSDDQLADSNVLFLRFRSLHSLPSGWSHTHSPSSHFSLSTPHPLHGPSLSLSGGVIKKAESGEDHTPWRWPGGRGDGARREKWALEDETGELRGQEDVSFRRGAECGQSLVEWGTELRTWLPPSCPSSLISSLSLSPLWPVEIIRNTPSAQAGKGKSKEEETVTSHHGVVYLNLSPLLYPGNTKIAGAFSLHPFSQSDVVSKIKRDHISILSSPSSPSVKKTAAGGKTSKRVGSALKSGSMVSQASEDHSATETDKPPPPPPPHDPPTQPHDDKRDTREGVVYEQAGTYLWMEAELMKPLVPQRSLSSLAERVSEYIPQREAWPRREGGAERAVRGFRHVTSAISSSLLEEYREMFGWGGAVGGANMDERKQQLLQHLNSSGKHHSCKEQLKHAVVGVVRERYGNRTGFSDSAHCHAFLSSLYTFLSDQLHVGLQQVVSLDDPPETTPTPVDFDLLKHFANEAEDFQDYQLAEHYYQERVAAGGHVGQYWYDYGVFCLLIGQLDKAEQCLKEAIALDQKNIPALLLYGMVSCLGERFEEGSEFMELATTSDPSNIIAWCMRGLLYEQQAERVLEEMCYEEAVRVWRGREEKTYLVRGGEREGEGERGGASRARESQKEKDQSHASEGPPMSNLGGGGEGGREATASVVLSTSVEAEGETQEPPTTESAGGDEPTSSSKVEVQPEAPPTSEAPPTVGVAGEERRREDPRTAIFLQTASFLLDVHALKFAEMCLSHVLSSSSSSPLSLYHLLEARLHLHRQEYQQARDCLSSSLQTDIQSSWAWSLLGHTHHQLGELAEAQEAFQRCLLLQTPPPNQHSVLLHLALLHSSQNRFSEAKQFYLRASHNSPSGVSWRGVGVTCYKLGQLEQSEAALCEANILNNQDPLTWAYLSLVSLKTGRPVEAEQALKFAVKTGLGTGEEVVEEIRQEMMSHSQDPAHQHIPHLLTQLS